MANQWLRLWHDMPTDPKWRTIARVSKRSISEVMSVYLHVLVCASNATERGRTQSINSEDIASALDLETDHVDEILTAMQGRVIDGERVTGWDKRQPAKEDGAAERAKAWREAQKAEKERISNENERDRTQANAEERPDKDTDTDKDKKKNKYTFSSDDLTIAELMHEKISRITRSAKKPNIEAWADCIRLMRESDKRTIAEIRAVFLWANQDEFWKANILSPPALRKQFDKLFAKINSVNGDGKTGIGSNSAQQRDNSAAGRVAANIARERSAREAVTEGFDREPLVANGSPVRPQVDQQFRGSGGPGQRMGSVLEGDFSRTD